MLAIKSLRVDLRVMRSASNGIWKRREGAGAELVLEVVYQSPRATRLPDKKKSAQSRAGEE